MKKALTLLLALVMVLSLVACSTANQTTTGSKNDPTTKPTTGNTTVPGTTAQPTEPTQQPTTAPTEPAPTEPAPTEPIEPDTSIIVEDNDSFTLKVLSTESTEEAYIMTLYVANKTASLLSFTISNISANDYVCPDINVYMDVNGNETATEILYSERSVLDRNGVENPAKVEFQVYVMNGDTWSDVYSDTCVVYPMGEDAFVDDGGYTAQEGDTVLVDNDSCTVIVTGYNPEGEWGYTMNMYILNKTDVTLTFSMSNVTVNGLMLDPWWATDVAAGKRAHCSVIWYGTEIVDYNIGDVTMISFDLTAMDATDWEATDLAGVSTTVYPMGEDAAKPFERVEQETDIVLMDNEFVTITITNIGMDEEGNYVMVLFLENHADVNVFIKPSTVCLNGIEMDPWWGTTVTAGKATFGSIMWFGGDLEYNGITVVETITMTMSIFDEFGEETFVAEDLVINP